MLEIIHHVLPEAFFDVLKKMCIRDSCRLGARKMSFRRSMSSLSLRLSVTDATTSLLIVPLEYLSLIHILTSVGMMDCKKALTEADGDFDKAIELLREKGLAKACLLYTSV